MDVLEHEEMAKEVLGWVVASILAVIIIGFLYYAWKLFKMWLP